MESSISFSTKFGWISAFARGNKVTSIQFKELKQKHSPSFILYKLRKNINLYFQGKKKRINTVLTAHNLEDQVETFFIRLSRGSGLTGLSSMKTLSKMKDY